jgi:hypothetical protein
LRVLFSCLLAGILLAIGAVVFADAIFTQQARSETAASRIGTPFAWPDDIHAADPEMALRILAEASVETATNVLRTTIGTATSGRAQITHYVFISRSRTRLFDDFTLAAGRWLTPTESRSSAAIVSSARVGTRDNIGVPAVVGHRYDLTFAPLRQAFDSLPTAGRYVVESADWAAADRFLAVVCKRLTEAGVSGMTIGDLTAVRSQSSPDSTVSWGILPYVLVGLATFIVAVLCVREGKHIGVLRLLGHSAPRIWYQVVGRLQLGASTLALGVCLAVAFAVPGVDAGFLRVLLVTFAEVAAIEFTATACGGLLIIRRVHIADLVKGRLQ